MLNKIKQWLEEKQTESRLMNKGKLMYHKKEKLKGTEDLLIQKGWFKAEREELRSIERLKRFKESNQRMKISNGKNVRLGVPPYVVPNPNYKKPKPKKRKSEKERREEWSKW